MTGYFLEDFAQGQRFETTPVRLDEADIIAFARKYDPQIFHTDPEAAKDGPFGGLIASGHQTIGTAFAQFVQLGLIVDSSMGGPGMDDIEWPAPVRPGDELHTEVEVIEVRRSRSKPDRGILRMQFTTSVEGTVVSRYKTISMIRVRDAAAAGDAE